MPVYFADDGRGHVKIGHALDVKARLSSLRTSNPSICIIRVVDGSEVSEHWFHRRFRAQRISRRREWFLFHDDMMTVQPPDEIGPPSPTRRAPSVASFMRMVTR